MKVSQGTLNEVEEALKRYSSEVQRAGLTESTMHTYLLHAENFVRWLRGDFVPGTRATRL